MKVAFMGLMLAVQVLATATGAKAQTYGILWQNVTTGRFGVWQVSDHGTVRGAYDLTTPNPAYSRWPVPNRPNTYYYICGVSPTIRTDARRPARIPLPSYSRSA
jgi:hypothetical protein